ncbi:MAG: DUF4136 domain-containing protein [Cyclobacteriaceae bacterium]
MKRLLIISALAILAECSPQIRVFSDYDPDYDVWTYKTFDWGQTVNIEAGKNPLHYNELNDKRIKEAVRQQMTSRGYELTSDNPDLILHYHIIVDNQSVITTEPYGYRYSPYWMRTQTNVYSYREGTLILDLMDKKTNNLIWRGWAVSAIDEVDPEKVDDLIKTAISRIFKKFPKTQKKIQTSKEVALN